MTAVSVRDPVLPSQHPEAPGSSREADKGRSFETVFVCLSVCLKKAYQKPVSSLATGTFWAHA